MVVYTCSPTLQAVYASVLSQFYTNIIYLRL